MKKIVTLFLAVSAWAALPAVAQKDFRSGYIVNLQQDTLRGLVNYKSDSRNALSCTFKTTAEAAEQEFKPETLSAFGFTGGKTYESRLAKIVSRKVTLANTFPEEPVKGHTDQNFMEVLVRGKVNLYFLVDATAAPHFYIQKEQENVQELVQLEGYITNQQTGHRELYRSKKYVGTLTLAFADCPDAEVKKQIEKTELKLTALQNLVTRYNQAVSGKSGPVYTKTKPKVKWGLAAGINSNSLTIEAGKHYLGKGSYDGNTSWIAGGFMAIPLNLLNEKLWIQNTVLLTQKQFTANYDVASDYSYYYNNYDLNFELTYLGINPQLRYQTPFRTLKPYAGAGFSGNILLKSKQEAINTIYRTGYPAQNAPMAQPFEEFRTIEISFNASIGAKYPVNPALNLLLESRMETGKGFSPYSGIKTQVSGFTILAGLEF